MCGSLNPDCLLGRFGQKATSAFSDSRAIFIPGGVFRGQVPHGEGALVGLTLTFPLAFVGPSFCSV